MGGSFIGVMILANILPIICYTLTIILESNKKNGLATFVAGLVGGALFVLCRASLIYRYPIPALEIKQKMFDWLFFIIISIFPFIIVKKGREEKRREKIQKARASNQTVIIFCPTCGYLGKETVKDADKCPKCQESVFVSDTLADEWSQYSDETKKKAIKLWKKEASDPELHKSLSKHYVYCKTCGYNGKASSKSTDLVCPQCDSKLTNTKITMRKWSLMSQEEQDRVIHKEKSEEKRQKRIESKETLSAKSSFCRKCGAKIPSDSSFCPKCGAEVIE